MIVGKGDIAGTIEDREGMLFFASGVSNSSETRKKEYQREWDLLYKQPRNLRMVYFSSLSIYYRRGPYPAHKQFMEQEVKRLFSKYCILRLGNITWGSNPHTLINYLKVNPQAHIQDTYRYICTKSELNHWISMIPDFNTEMNITGKRMKVKEIASAIRNGTDL